MEQTALPANVRRLRSAKGLSQKALAQASGLSVAGYQKVERGESEPRYATARAIADALDVPVRHLYEPVRILRHVRFRSQKKLKTRGHVLADVARWLDDYQEVERLLGRRQDFALVDLRAPDSPAPRELAAAAREKLGLDDQPIFDPAGLLEERAKVKLLTTTVGSKAFFGLSVADDDGGPAVIVNTWVGHIPVERWIFSAMHELGHLLMHYAVAYDVMETEEIASDEMEADEFASYFLMPEERFRREWAEAAGKPFYVRVLKVKRIFKVSYLTVLRRLSNGSSQDLGSLIARFRAEHRRRTGQSLPGNEEPTALRDEPKHLLDIDFSGDRLEALVRQAVLEDKLSTGRAAEILDRSVGDMRLLIAEWRSECSSSTPASSSTS